MLIQHQTDRNARRGARIMGFDVLRGIAIGLVLLRHSWPDVFDGAGIVGVVAFFALSGYLITGILHRELQRDGSISFQRFYFNRAIRLLPPLAVVLIVFCVVEGIWNLSDGREGLGKTVIGALTYTMNIPGLDHGSPAMWHLWTLALEEQFYLIWPFLLLFFFRRNNGTAWTWWSVGLAVAVCVLSVVAVLPNPARVYSWPTTWVSCMLMGCAARLAPWSKLASWARHPLVAFFALLVMVTVSLVPNLKDLTLTYIIVGPLISACSIVLVLFFEKWKSLPNVVLMPCYWLGRLSYSAYLWNYPIVAWSAEISPARIAPFVAVGGTLIAATATWFLIEAPVAGLRNRVRERVVRSQPSPRSHMSET